MNNSIINELDKIISYIKDSKDYKEYLFLKEKLAKNNKAITLIKEIKKYQKKLVKLEINKENTQELEDKINNNLLELSKIPLYNDYIEKQELLDSYYQLIKNRLNDYFYQKLN